MSKYLFIILIIFFTCYYPLQNQYLNADDLLDQVSAKQKIVPNDVRLRDEDIDMLLNSDIRKKARFLRKNWNDFDNYPDQLQRVLLDIEFQIGDVTPQSWPNLSKAIKKKDLDAIIKEIYTPEKTMKVNFYPQNITDKKNQALMMKTIKIGVPDHPNIEQRLRLNNYETKEGIFVKNCFEYFSALNKGYNTSTTFDTTMESFFIERCNPLLFSTNSIKADNNNFTKFSFHTNELNKLPAIMGELFRYNRHLICNNSSSFGDCLQTHILKSNSDIVTVTPTEINIKTAFRDVGYEVMAKGDFNKDGWNDLLINFYFVSNKGTARHYGSFCLEHPKNLPNPIFLNCFQDELFKQKD